ncbi:MAG: hypothetical protein AAB587_00390 [Patescibacteria group bacterium]
MKGVRTYILLGALVLIGIIILGVSFGRSTYIAKKNPLGFLISQKTLEDRDGDGLKDWEEALWKTSLDNPDTDGDGTPDGEEVNKGRNPLVPGPNDPMENVAQEANTTEKITATDQLARDLFSLYVAKKKLGESVSEADQNALIKRFFSGSETLQNARVYNTTDIQVAQNTDAKTYANAVMEILTKEGNVMSTQDAVDIVQKALETEDENELKKLDVLVIAYQKITGKLLLVPTPPQTVGLHLSLINSFESLSEDIVAIQKIFNDSLQGLFYLKRYVITSIPTASKAVGEITKLVAP